MAAPSLSEPSSLEGAIRKAIETRTRQVVEEEAKNAAERVESRVREEAGAIAIRVAQHVEMNYRGNLLTIHVHVPSPIQR